MTNPRRSSEGAAPRSAAVDVARDASVSTPGAEIATVVELLRSISRSLVVGDVVQAVVTAAVRDVGAAHAALTLFAGDTWSLAGSATARRDGIDVSAGDALTAEGPRDALIAEVVRTRQMAGSIRSRSAWPVVRDERLLGVLCLEGAEPAAGASPAPMFLAALLAGQAAVSLEHAQRHEAAAKENEERRTAAVRSERIQAALQDSEARFRLMAEATPDVIWITQLDPESVVYASPSFERIWGKKVADLYADPHLWIEGIHPEDRDRIAAAFGAWIGADTGSPWEAEFRVLQPAGGIRWIHERGVFISEGGATQRVSGISTDITERRLAEIALRDSEERYALAMEAARDGHWDWIAATDSFYASPRLLEIYGFPADTRFSGRQDFLDRFPFHPEDEPRWRVAAREHFASKEARFDIELRLLRKGEVRWIHTNGLITRDAEGRPTRYTGSVSDITLRKAAEHALRDSEQRFALVVAGSTDGIWDWDVATDRMFLSERAQSLYGLVPDATLRPPPEWMAMVKLHPDDAHLQSELVANYLAGRVPAFDGEWRVLQPDGSYRWLRLQGTSVRDAAGKLTRMAGSVNDVDFRRRAQAALQQAQRLEALGTLAGGIAHDFNNILGAILGFGEMAVRDSRVGSRVRRDIECILTAGERGRSLVERILAFSRSGVGERVPVHLEGVVEEVVAMISAGLPSHVRIELDLDGGLAATLGDSTQLHQVVMNLATNAIQAMPRGGVLGIALERVCLREPLLVTTGTVAIGDYLLLTVRDAGTGIAADVLGRIFDPFFTTKEVGAGTGLGLALVHGIVAELGGAVDVATTAGAGSTFTVYLPRFGDAVAPTRDEGVALQRGSNERVLVVDDEEPLVHLLTQTLLDLGYAPVPFVSGKEALAAFGAQPGHFDALVTDERMPGLSGTELIRAVRLIRPTIPVLLVSGYPGARIDRDAREAGADVVLRKPLVTAKLAAALAIAIRGRTPTRSPA